MCDIHTVSKVPYGEVQCILCAVLIYICGMQEISEELSAPTCTHIRTCMATCASVYYLNELQSTHLYSYIVALISVLICVLRTYFQMWMSAPTVLVPTSVATYKVPFSVIVEVDLTWLAGDALVSAMDID